MMEPADGAVVVDGDWWISSVFGCVEGVLSKAFLHAPPTSVFFLFFQSDFYLPGFTLDNPCTHPT